MIEVKRLVGLVSVTALLTVAGGGIAVAAGAYAFGQRPGPNGWSGGSAYNYASPAEAQDHAMSSCRSRTEGGEYCKVIANVNGKCFAIAVQDGGNGYGWNTASTEPEAQVLALKRCTGYGKSCAIHASFCDTKTPTSVTPPQAPPAPASPPGPTSPSTGGGSPACQKFPDLC